MNRFSSRLVIALSTGLLCHTALAADPVAVVNGSEIPAERAQVMLDEQRAQGAEDNTQLRDAVREELIRREVLSQAAEAQGLDERTDVRSQMELARQAILIRAYLQDYARKNPVTDAQLQKEYENIKSRMGGKEYKPRHILVETENEAKAVIARLQAGEDFAEVAKVSQDPGSSDKGGELGWSNPGMYVEPFGAALRDLEKGEYTRSPVKSDFGFHVIQLDDVRDIQPPSFEEVKPQLEKRMQQSTVESHMLDLRSKAEIK